jgi:large subunit ribosomal protein L34e
MPAPRFRSRTLRRIKKTTPGGKTKKYYYDRKPGLPRCAECGIELKGIPRMSRCEAMNAPKSAKRPQRPYGGFLCSACTRLKLKNAARAAEKN